jgi:hypothetical protein
MRCAGLVLAGALTACTGPSAPIPCDEEERPGCPSSQACDYGECADFPLYTCDETTGEWVEDDEICEGFIVDASGDLLLEQSLSSVAVECPPLTPRSFLHLSVEPDGTVTAAPPITILAGLGMSGYDVAGVQATLQDDWGSYAPTLSYDLLIEGSGVVLGEGEIIDTGCDAQLFVTGEQCPLGVWQCTVYDDGWNVWCEGGFVYSDGLTRYAYCLPDSNDEVCETGGEGHARRVATCAGGCADTDVHWHETSEEHDAFDLASLCAP